tara:strand:+ start:2277 stop:3425 length:1149 start_codon:yes stop_codon:yes gene_type:complete
VKKIPYGRQYIDDEDINNVISTLKSDFLTQGPKVKEFEKKFAKYVGCKYSIATNSATSALHLAVLALNLKKGDRVITTPISFAATSNCIRYVGAEVWFADIDPNTYLLDIDSVIKLLDSKPQGFFKGIIPVDFAGLPVNMEIFKDLAIKYNLWIIEDSCHAPGGFFIDSHGKKNYCGSANYSDICVFSFHPVKHIACGEGGMLTTNSLKVYKKIELLRSHGISKEYIDKRKGGWVYEMIDLGYNYRLTDIQSALGLSQLSKNKKGVKKRNIIAKRYKNSFEGKIKFQSLPKNTFNAHHLFIIEIDNRKGLYDYLLSKKIYTQIHYIPIHKLPYYQKIGYDSAILSNSENYYKKCISLPMYPTLSKEEQDYVIKNVLNFYAKI